MWDLILQIIGSKYTGYVAVAALVWFVAKFYFERFKPLENKVEILYDFFWDLFFTILKLTKSPIGLREGDYQTIQQSGFDKEVENKKEVIKNEYSKIKPQPESPFDVQKTIISLVIEMERKNLLSLTTLKNQAFQEGRTESETYIIAGLYTWEKFFKETNL